MGSLSVRRYDYRMVEHRKQWGAHWHRRGSRPRVLVAHPLPIQPPREPQDPLRQEDHHYDEHHAERDQIGELIAEQQASGGRCQSTAKHRHEVLNSEAGVGDDVAERTGP